MSTRLDRLISLLETGSTPQIKATAAKQLGEIAKRSFKGSALPTVADIKDEDQDVLTLKPDRQRQNELGEGLESDAEWREVMGLIGRVLPHLRSKSYETRTAAALALEQISRAVPIWSPPSLIPSTLDPTTLPPSPTPPPPLNLPPLLLPAHPKLLASSGKEFAAPLVPTTKEEVEASKAEVLKRLGISAPGGLDFGFGELVREELNNEEVPPAESLAPIKREPSMEDIKPSFPPSTQSTPSNSPKISSKAPSKAALKKAEKERMEEEEKKRKAEEEEEFKGLSARQINALKRKRKAAGGSALGGKTAGPSPSIKPKISTSVTSTSSTTSLSSPASSITSNPLSAPVIVAPKPPPAAESNNPTGGSISTPSKPEWGATLIVPRDAHNREAWPFAKVVEFLGVGLFSDAWEVRHGAALGLREIIKVQGKGMGKVVGYPSDLNDRLNANQLLVLGNSLLSLLALDRFGDYNSDQVVAPVRETASQTLASTMVHLGREGVEEVHKVLVAMVRQDWLGGGGKNGNGKGYAWEVRHAGLLGLKYEVAVRGDLLGSSTEEADLKVDEPRVTVKMEEDGESEWKGENREMMLKDVVDAAVLGLRDADDDVRSVSAACLLPVSTYLVEHLPEELGRVLTVLWDALGEGGDELGSSTGVIMNLLSKLITFPQCISLMKTDPLTLLDLIPRLYPFFRHTITAVRLAVPNALHIFLTAPAVESTEWIDARLFQFLFQNLIVEERAEIREATLKTFKAAIKKIPLLPPIGEQAFIGPLSVSLQPHLVEWSTILMSPPGVPLDPALFLKANTLATGKFGKTTKGGDSQQLGYNVDKNVMAQDLSLFSVDDVIRGRLAAAEGLALLIAHDATAFEPHFAHLMVDYLGSTSSHQMIFASILIEEWTKLHDHRAPPSPTSAPAPLVPLSETNENAKMFVIHLIAILEGKIPSSYYEMLLVLGRIYTECQALLNFFVTDGKVSPDLIPTLPPSLVPTEPPVEVFTVETAGEIARTAFDALLAKITRKTMTPNLSGLLRERQMRIVSAIGFYMAMKEKHDRQVSAAVAAAVIALRTMPAKLNPVIRSIMNGVKFEENINLQIRFSHSVASLVEFCSNPASVVKANPTDKIIKNLCTFVCQDMAQTPVFSNTKSVFDGILSLQQTAKPAAGRQAKEVPAETEEEAQSRITRRGANLALGELATRFGPRLFEDVPKLWDCVSSPLLTSYAAGVEPADHSVLGSDQIGQDVIDSLTALSVVVVQLNSSLHPQVLSLLPSVINTLQSQFAVLRQAAARCIAAVCDVSPALGMKDVVRSVLPFLGDPTVAKRQGATEAVSYLVRTLDTRALPYVLFMIVPILGRMSDPNDDVRLLATSTFASLVKMVPLEAGIPDPPGFPEELLSKRAGEREFLEQLLDGSKVSSYEIPVTIKAELRKYQKEGINWLAFLAKYQLHGILCDDMGLGKSLQSLCILASKHHERAERFKLTGSPDSVHLPSLIVCPSTLTGHWYHEILKFTDNLQPLLYVGNYRERVVLQSSIRQRDVVIMSYEVVRNDIEELSQFNWNYCILDEGHIIKNAKTKLTKAVKLIKANHRLVLSGTPIQNNVLELWSLFDFLMPGFLGTEKSFNDRYGKPISVNRDGKATVREREAAALALEALHKQVLPFLLRRLKEDVLHDLPPKIIQDYYCDLSDVQKQLYDDFSHSSAGQTAGNLVKSSGESQSGKQGQAHVFQSLQYLRKLCNHPCLVAKDSDYPAISAKVTKAGGVPGPNSIRDLVNAPKLLALKQILHDCGIGAAEPAPSETEDLSLSSIPQHRVLIFCQLKLMLDVIESDLFRRHMPTLTYMRMDGSTDPSKRHGVVQTFNSDPSIDVLLLTTQVGGLGLNLTGADTVIFVEHDWNPMKDLQAMDRAHRLGQKKVVNVYRLITKGTLEDKIMGLQRFKLNIASSVVTQQNAGLESMNTDQVLDLFKISTGEEDASAAAAKKKAQEQSGPVSQQNLLEGLEDLPDEDEYQGLGMDSFLGSL